MKSSSPGSVVIMHKILVIGHDAADARYHKRLQFLRDSGWAVLGAAFDRQRGNDRSEIAGGLCLQFFNLGPSRDRDYLQRLGGLIRAGVRLWKHRGVLADLDAIWAINLDNVVLAWLIRLWLRRSIIIYEVADIQPVMLGMAMPGRLLRAAERRLLKRASLLVTTSPAFLREYFVGRLGYRGDSFILENKVYPSDHFVATAPTSTERLARIPLKIGCFGLFRCQRSLQAIEQIALEMPGQVEFVIRGYAVAECVAGLERLANLPNVRVLGPYRYPQELAGIYAEVDACWAIEASAVGGNSDWLLPNRLYEAGLFGVPLLALAGTELGRRLEQRNWGWLVREPIDRELVALFRSLVGSDELVARRRALFRAERSEFLLDHDLASLDQTLRQRVQWLNNRI